MKPGILILVVALFALPGCEKVKGLLGGLSRPTGNFEEVLPGGAVDPELAAMVQREGGEVRFRKDLTYPISVEVRMREAMELKETRVFDFDPVVGRSTAVVTERRELEAHFSKGPGTFGLTLNRIGQVYTEEQKKAIAEKMGGFQAERGSELVGKTIDYTLTKDGWQTRPRSGAVDFKKEVWSDSLADRLNQIMIDSGAHPRVQWFSSSRTWRKGEEIVLTGDALKILDPYDVSGRVSMVYDGEEAVGGHPCGVFLLSGDLVIKNRPILDGTRGDAEVSVSAGKIWASLLYPVILREEYESVQTLLIHSGNKESPQRRAQGAVNVTRSRTWQVK